MKLQFGQEGVNMLDRMRVARRLSMALLALMLTQRSWDCRFEYSNPTR